MSQKSYNISLVTCCATNLGITSPCTYEKKKISIIENPTVNAKKRMC